MIGWEQLKPLNSDDHENMELADEYARRVRSTLLPNIPLQVLAEWFHRHWQCLDDYAWLDYRTLDFGEAPELWSLERIPGREAFSDPSICDDFGEVIRQKAWYPSDWLAEFMVAEGTWPWPVVLLHTTRRLVSPFDHEIRRPRHLLEGHRRLSILNVLRDQDRARAAHPVWVVRKEGA